MKLLSVHAENYGVLAGRKLEFSEDFHVIYGPNEAGKSTLLQLIRESLFGFPHRSPFRWESAQRMAATVRLQLADGRHVHFRRQKGSPDDLSGEIEETTTPLMSEQDLWALMPGVNEQLFQNVYAFSLAELSQGQQSLKDAGLADVLLGGGLRGLNQFREIEDQIATEREELFASRARKRELNRVLEGWNDAQNQYQASRVSPREFDELKARAADHQGVVDRLGHEIAGLRQRESEFDRLLRAIPISRRIRELEAKLAGSDPIPETTEEHVEALCRRLQRLTGIEEELLTIQSELASQETTSDAEIDSNLLEHEAAIAQRWQDVSRIRKLQADLTQLNDELQSAQYALEQHLTDLGPDWTSKRLETIHAGLADREEISELTDRERELAERRSGLEARRPEIDRRLQGVRDELHQLDEGRSISGLQSLLDRGEAYRLERHQLSELTAEQTDNQAELERRTRELNRALGEQREDWSDVDVPLIATVQEWQERVSGLRDKLREANEELDRAEERSRRNRTALEEFDGLHPRLDPARLQEIRIRRENAWIRIQSRFAKDDQDQPLVKGTTTEVRGLLDDFHQLVLEADAFADAQCANAEFVAKREQLTHEWQHALQHLEDVRMTVERAREAVLLADQQWHELWVPSTIVPLPPSSMLEWMAKLDQWKAIHIKCRQAGSRMASLSETIGAFERELSRAFPDLADDPTSALKRAAIELQHTQQAHAHREHLQRELAGLEQQRDEIEQEQFELSLHNGELESDAAELVSRVGLPRTCSLRTAERTLLVVQDAHRHQLQRTTLERELQAHQDEIADFTRHVCELSSAIAPDLAEHPVCEAIEQMHDRLVAARTLLMEQSQASSRTADLTHRLGIKKSEVTQLRAALRHDCARLGLATPEMLDTLLAALKQRTAHQHALASLYEQLDSLSIGQDRLRDELQSREPSEIETEQAESLLRRERLEREYDQQQQQLGAVVQKLEEFASQDRGQFHLTRISHFKSRFQDVAERWAALTLATAVLKRARQRFERDHQPAILAHVSDLFSRLTEGRYVEVRKDYEDRTDCHVVTDQGDIKETRALSTGTREQLYLALRLGYLLECSDTSETLPIVMDDVLVNFDEHRAERTLEVLREFSQSIQVLLLTCHRKTVDAAAQFLTRQAIWPLIPGTLESPPPTGPTVPVPASARKRRERKSDEQSQPALFPNP